MPINVYVAGHGSWPPDFGKDDPRNAFETVPQRCIVHYYVENLKLMIEADVRAFMRGDINPEPVQTCDEGKSYPNMKITPDSADNRVAQENCLQMGAANGKISLPAVFYSPSKAETLKEAIEEVRRIKGENQDYVFHWLCCRSPYGVLKKFTREGGELGIRAQQRLQGDYRFIFYDRSGPTRTLIKTVK